MTGFNGFIDSLSVRQRVGLGFGVAMIVLAAGVVLFLTFRPRYEVLFRDLNQQDAAAVSLELEKAKVPFRISDDGATISVPEGEQRSMRLKVMSGSIHLQGTAGFELFEHADLGQTEFAQKVNYQRALQGELARTIMSLDEVRLARVHVSIPESSLFKRSENKPRASVALFLQDGATLRASSADGIRRLVAASIPELKANDVIIVDEHGAANAPADFDQDDAQLAQQRSIERFYAQKIQTQIAPFISPERATVSATALLDLDTWHTSQEDQVRVPRATVGSRWSVPPLPTAQIETGLDRFALPAEDERTSRRTQETTHAAGVLRRLSVSIVLDKPIDAQRRARIESVVSAAIGFDAKRGDVIDIQVAETRNGSVTTMDGVASPVLPALEPSSPQLKIPSRWVFDERQIIYALGAIGIAIVMLLLFVLALRKRKPTPLTQAQRDSYVRRLNSALSTDARHVPQ